MNGRWMDGYDCAHRIHFALVQIVALPLNSYVFFAHSVRSQSLLW
jgi:hypothetical protein